MEKIAYCSRDNARTRVQWNASKNAGFTDGDETWLKVNPDYVNINAESAELNPDSVLHYYKKLIKLRKADKSFVYGTYRELLHNNRKLLVYLRKSEYGTLLVVNNFANATVKLRIPKNIKPENFRLITSNYSDTEEHPSQRVLRPYESAVYKLS